MSEIIVHCPECGGALSVTPRVREAHISHTYNRLQVHFQFADIAHKCTGGDA